ncbi:hypothetical protein CgunFtcFv8_025656 [Champsocephalus gunnari]|uniref:Uncharacterized protein n=1 Tax=Champsocephalus gunnari TaxID=52237 RepID=A0AAN8CBZ3_CHAGU|nr:hypothetical protein CgunFtcFv8_025656 [Champsocephalus gunnari]
MRQRRRILCNKRNGGVARNTAVFCLNGELLTEDKLRAKLCGFLLKELSSGIPPPPSNTHPRRGMGLFLCVGITALLFLCTGKTPEKP